MAKWQCFTGICRPQADTCRIGLTRARCPPPIYNSQTAINRIGLTLQVGFRAALCPCTSGIPFWGYVLEMRAILSHASINSLCSGVGAHGVRPCCRRWCRGAGVDDTAERIVPVHLSPEFWGIRDPPVGTRQRSGGHSLVTKLNAWKRSKMRKMPLSAAGAFAEQPHGGHATPQTRVCGAALPVKNEVP